MQREHQKAKRLPPVVFTMNVGVFVCDNVGHILLIHIERQINLRFYNPKHKGRNNVFTLIDIIT